jgi:hypothetical protein
MNHRWIQNIPASWEAPFDSDTVISVHLHLYFAYRNRTYQDNLIDAQAAGGLSVIDKETHYRLECFATKSLFIIPIYSSTYYIAEGRI